ncbi:hypothetical protein [Blastococcus capsensis]|uniref:hypothetical protein n=1 Tax=Blastococcus capsensis TaxID=1564163 RepID=UPI0025403A94|nr:hypothetical protein [Blastococcus capsensis]MDK3257755.1 hypothetical protein [Blastococcus capsensis]
MTAPTPLRADAARPAIPRRMLVLPFVMLAVVGCSGGRDLPDADEFAAGPCRDAAPAVLALDEQVRLALEEDADLAAVRESLRDEQATLQEVLGGADGRADVAPELEEVVTRVGFARVALDTGTLDGAVASDVTSAVDRLVAVCVAEDT